jgi:hypothetical protein
MTVRDRHGLMVGVEDLLIDRSSGGLRYLAISAGRRVPGRLLVPLDTELRTPSTGGHLGT